MEGLGAARTLRALSLIATLGCVGELIPVTVPGARPDAGPRPPGTDGGKDTPPADAGPTPGRDAGAPPDSGAPPVPEPTGPITAAFTHGPEVGLLVASRWHRWRPDLGRFLAPTELRYADEPSAHHPFRDTDRVDAAWVAKGHLWLLRGTTQFGYALASQRWVAPEDLSEASPWSAAGGPFFETTTPVDAAWVAADGALLILRGGQAFRRDPNTENFSSTAPEDHRGDIRRVPAGAAWPTPVDAAYATAAGPVFVRGERRLEPSAEGWNEHDARAPDDPWSAGLGPFGPRVPFGYGVAGRFQHDTHARWFHNWSLPSDAPLWRSPRAVPMIWGGPPPAEDTPTPEGCGRQWGQRCRPGCANQDGPGCAEDDPAVQDYLRRIEDAVRWAQSDTWLIFNEPELADQAFLNPEQAAWLYERIYDRIRAQNPRAQLFCCGTAPGLQDGSLGPDWLARFAAALTRPVHGLHLHGHVNEVPPRPDAYFDRSKIRQLLLDFARTTDRLPALQGRPILLSEWGAPRSGGEHRCSGNNNLAEVMAPVARWLNEPAPAPRYIGAAWFWAGQAGGGRLDGASLFLGDGTPSCLGAAYLGGEVGADEHPGYRWGLWPVP